jgi:hypothetical protein
MNLSSHVTRITEQDLATRRTELKALVDSVLADLDTKRTTALNVGQSESLILVSDTAKILDDNGLVNTVRPSILQLKNKIDLVVDMLDGYRRDVNRTRWLEAAAEPADDSR